jgi:O-antigen/teichoic acid export membrane protein
MTAFSTTRTISNVSLQGISTVINPAMPEFMRYLREKDGARVDSVMGFLLFLTVIVFAPILVGLQLIIPDIFLLWTRGKIEFDGFLFGLFSISLMVYAIGRPLFAIVQGNNLVKSQLIISTTVGLVAIFGVIAMSSYFGIRGAAAALLFAEIVGCALALIYGVKWLSIHQMQLPYKLFYLAGTSILMATFGILLMAAMPEKKLMIFSTVFVLCTLLGYAFVRQLPKIALDKLETILLILSWQKRAL